MKNRFGGIRSNFLLCLCVPVVMLSLSSCAEVSEEFGLSHTPELLQRMGPTGTESNPAVLDPFKSYVLVMTEDECRFLSMKVPSQWYWKVSLTAVCRDEKRSGHLEAELSQGDGWQALPDTRVQKRFDLLYEGVQAVLGLGNQGSTKVALLKLCQQGCPVKVTLASQISPLSQLPALPQQAKPLQLQ